ncbi:hypothetical protein CROQUDRAFT_78363 [Cronartium quercuum f. sp. fusiforme G11]|uniref:Mitochondrial import inner membrane translocase subunit TIM54 n=1 Tax=Cronartium quercuum f. sp. fusiforme G11 TaxID=708437 RepID=A0A9P6NH82_9BASI|nr:hypothetical protein CROQUDRAFT_78363 [Cronartium quercuum f. sp. fusiforme G11]
MKASISTPTTTTTTTTNRSVNPAFRYLGIPQSWLLKRPRLPSHKTSAFLLISTSTLTLYLYDRYQCRKLKEIYVEETEHLSKELLPNSSTWLPRRVTVYGARVPEDVDVDRGAQWFKKYVKPILIAAAIDYRIENGTSPGALGRKIASDIHDERIIKAAQEKDGFKQPSIVPGMPGYQSWHFQQNRIAGANLILGRVSLKEYLWGLKKGYRQPLLLDGLEDEERLARSLNDEGLFDEPESNLDFDESLPEGLRSVSEQLRSDNDLTIDHELTLSNPESDHHTPSPASWFGSLTTFSTPNPPTNQIPLSPANQPLKTLSPTSIPEQPPLLLVPFDHPIGMIWWPLKLYRFFNRREEVKKGAEVAKSLILNQTEAIQPPTNLSGINQYCGWISNEKEEEEVDFSVKLTGSIHLDFLAPEADNHLKKSYKKAFKTINEERNLFREQLKERLIEARRFEHQPDVEGSKSTDEVVTEVQLRQEALRKEKKWRDAIEGWKIVRAGSGVCWDDEMAQSLRVFVSAGSVDRQDVSEAGV